MATKKTETTPTQDRSVVPLKDIAITFPYRSPWANKGETRTVTGAQLIGILQLVGHRLGQDASEREAGVDLMSYSMRGLSEILKMATRERPEECDLIAALEGLSDILEFMWIGIRSFEGDPTSHGLDEATVTIGAPAGKAAA